jgi:glucose dehydrogenase
MRRRSLRTGCSAKFVRKLQVRDRLLTFTLLASAAFNAGGAAPQPPPSAAPPEDGEWTMPGKNAASTRFSGLDQINSGNVSSLRVEFTFSTGVLRRSSGSTSLSRNPPLRASPAATS